MSILEYNEEEELKKIRASERRGGYDTGKLEGKLEERKEILLEILEQKGEITELLKKKIQTQNDMAVLKDWLQKACTIDSIEEFEKRM